MPRNGFAQKTLRNAYLNLVTVSCKRVLRNKHGSKMKLSSSIFLEISGINRKMVEKFKDQRANTITVRGTGRTPATVNRELEVLSKIFSLAMDDEIIESNPCRKVKKLRMDNRRTRHLALVEKDQLMAALSGRRSHLKPLVTVAI